MINKIYVFFSGYSNQLWRVWSRNRIWFSHNWRWGRSRWFKNHNTSVSRTIKYCFGQKIWCYIRKWQLLFLHILCMQYTWRRHLGRGFLLLWISGEYLGFLPLGHLSRVIGNAPVKRVDGCQDLLVWLRTSVCSWTHTLATRGQELSAFKGTQWSRVISDKGSGDAMLVHLAGRQRKYIFKRTGWDCRDIIDIQSIFLYNYCRSFIY